MRLTPNPAEPLVKAGTIAGRDLDYFYVGVDLARVAYCPAHIEIEVGQQIRLVEDHQGSRSEHVRILQRLILSLRDRKDDDPGVLTQIEHRWTNKVANVFDHDDGSRGRLEFRKSTRDHIGLEVTSCARVHLHGRSSGASNAFAVVDGRLIALDHKEGQLIAQTTDRALEKRRFPSTRRTYQVQSEDFAAGKPGTVSGREQIILGQDSGLQLNDPGRFPVPVIVHLPIVVGVAVRIARRVVMIGVIMRMMMVVVVVMTMMVTMIVMMIMVMVMVMTVVMMMMPIMMVVCMPLPVRMRMGTIVRTALSTHSKFGFPGKFGRLASLEVNNSRARPCTTAAMSTHQAASSSTSMLLIRSSSPCSRVNRRDPQRHGENRVA